jgi:hypothetical protein
MDHGIALVSMAAVIRLGVTNMNDIALPAQSGTCLGAGPRHSGVMSG